MGIIEHASFPASLKPARNEAIAVMEPAMTYSFSPQNESPDHYVLKEMVPRKRTAVDENCNAGTAPLSLQPLRNIADACKRNSRAMQTHDYCHGVLAETRRRDWIPPREACVRLWTGF
mmetsp:Transcript_16073/g.38581  ORF Transcript_16073/g.38581 Transcript_16073/m.38581 type:complete len:118 (+) Transcript_16073:691-1044(+)